MANNLKRAIDTDLSCLRVSERQRAEILDNALEGKKVKKKMSVAFVLVMTLVLAAAVALAVVSITETGRLMAQTEKDNGFYEDWPVEKRVQIVTELMDEGCIPETDERKQLRDGTLTQEEALRVTDAAIEELTGQDVSEASFITIMAAVWGPFEDWTYEQQAWYSQVMVDVGYEKEGHTYFVVPTGEIDEAQAIALARKELAEGFEVDESVLDGYHVETSFQIPEFAEKGDTQAYWYVYFTTWGTDLKEDEVPFTDFELFIHPVTGKPLETVKETLARRAAYAEMQKDPLRATITAFEQGMGDGNSFEFAEWSLEDKARWSEEITPQIVAYLDKFAADGTDPELMFNMNEVATASFRYALPDEQAMPVDQALTLAGQALQDAYGLTDLQRDLLITSGIDRYICKFYDVTDPERPLWKFFLRMPTEYDEAVLSQVKAAYGNLTYGDYNLLYKVDMDARTGEIIRTWTTKYADITVDFYRDCY